VSATAAQPVRDATVEARRHAHVAGLVGLVARGILYLLLAGLALHLVVGNRQGNDVDARGAMSDLAGEWYGTVLLLLLATGFAGFALWYAFVALGGERAGRDTSDRLADGMRAVVYAVLAGLAVSFLLSARPEGDTDRKQQAWTATVLEWPGGRLLVVLTGVVVVGVGAYLVWRALSGQPQDSRAILDAAPRETRTVHVLGALGNGARGAIVGLVGIFTIVAGLEHDASETAGLDGSLKRVLDEPFGKALVVVVALGLAAYAVYSIARALVNRNHRRRLAVPGPRERW
jgi:hypothetical protein